MTFNAVYDLITERFLRTPSLWTKHLVGHFCRSKNNKKSLMQTLVLNDVEKKLQ